MAKLRLQYIHEYADRHGKVRRYFRHRNVKGPLPGIPGSAEFMAAYQKFLGVDTHACPARHLGSALPGSFGALINEFYGSRPFLNLKQSSRHTYKCVLEPLAAKHGHRDARKLDHKTASTLIEDIGATKPAMANLTRSVLKRVMQYGIKAGYVDANPFIGIDRHKVGSFHCWTEGELQQFEQRWPMGTRQRLAFELLLRTAQRGGDVVKMKRSDIVNGELHVIPQKTGVELYLPVAPELERALRAYPANGLTLIAREDGRPITRAGLQRMMCHAVEAAGLPPRWLPHGLRKACLRRLAESGATEKQIASWSGHKSPQEVARYTAAADQRQLAKDAISRGRK
jgi:integrase